MNTVIYARYSSERQTEQSIEGQLRICYAYAERCGYNIVGEYIDRAVSGTTDNRPEFQRMINDSAKKQFQFVLVYKLDRFARNRYDSAIYKTKLKKNGAKVISATESIGDGDESIILEAVLEAMAETYSRQLSQNVKRGLRESAYKGYYTGGHIPFGYDVIDKKLVINEREADIVKYIFDLYCKGTSKTNLVKELKTKGYMLRNHTFGITNLTQILNNVRYTGKYYFCDEIEIECPSIITQETFDKCMERQKINKKIMGQKIVNNIEYILSTKIFCGKCGMRMTGDSGTSRTGDKHYYYACHNKKKYRICDKKNERKNYLENIIIEKTLSFISHPTNINYIANEVMKEYEKCFNFDEIKKMEQTSKQIEKELDECVESLMKTDSKLIIDRINKKAGLLELQKNNLEIDLIKLKIAADVKITAGDIKKWLLKFCDNDINDIEYRKQLIDVLINSIFIYDDKIVIYYNVRGKTEDITFDVNTTLINNQIGSDSAIVGQPKYCL